MPRALAIRMIVFRKSGEILIITLVIFSIIILFQTKKKIKESLSTTPSRLRTRSIPDDYQPEDIKYILQWTPDYEPFNFIGDGRKIFIKHECEYTNCYTTYQRSYFKSLKEFHAIIFNARDVYQLKKSELPTVRSETQKYIFASKDSAQNQPCCLSHLNDFFNWTWTYRLDSDIRWSLLTIYDKKGNFIGPKTNMNWPSKLKPLSQAQKEALKTKNRAVAWFNSNCKSKSKREVYALALMDELKTYGLDLDIVGKCGNMTCPKTRYDIHLCSKMLKENYYFYLAFENSFSIDFVTENLLTALKSSTIPIVYGGADYSRFLPPGSYLNARSYSPKDLAKQISKIMNHKDLYYNFLRWKNHYYYTQTWDSEDICSLCSALNNEGMYRKKTVYHNFMEWWNPEGTLCKTRDVSKRVYYKKI